MSRANVPAALSATMGIGYFIWHGTILFAKLFINILFFNDFNMARNNLTGWKQPKSLFLKGF
jgi:hypothetical protein